MINYNAFSSTFAQSRKNMKWPEIEHFIEDLKGRTKLRCLDVGCGSGRLYGELKNAKIKAEYLGVDNSSGMIDEARKAHPDGNFEVLDMLSIDTLDTKFDAIFLLASFHHLETESERLLVLKKLKKILAENGIVYMTNWNLFSEENMERYATMYRGNGDFDIKIGSSSRYYHSFTTEELAGLFKKSDFQVIENRIFEGERNIASIFYAHASAESKNHNNTKPIKKTAQKNNHLHT